MPVTLSWRAEHARGVLASWVDRLPPRMRRVVTPEMVGFAMLGLFTFAVDLVLLAALQRWTPLPLPISVTLAYAAAFGLNYLLNRTLNFGSHAPVGPQLARFTLVIGCDFGITLGVTTGLSGIGVDFRLARVIAAACVAVFTYTACRWWVFRDTLPPPGTGVPPQAAPRTRSGRV